jgi:hypothetical protein
VATKFVYALVDPREPRAVRYVGCGAVPARRLQQHVWDARFPTASSNCRKVLFIQQMLCEGVIPGMVILEAVPAQRWVARERHWIELFRARGSDLTNFERPSPTCSYEKADSNPGAVNFFRRSQ